MKQQNQKKQTRTILAVLAIILVIALVIKFRNKSKASDTPATTSTGHTSSASSTSSAQSPSKALGNNATLKQGTKALEVKYMQSYYNEKIAVPGNKTKLVVDGIFGSKTLSVVKTITGSSTTTWTAFKNLVDIKANPMIAGYSAPNTGTAAYNPYGNLPYGYQS